MLLARHFLTAANGSCSIAKRLGADAAAILQCQPWRGNVRELKALMERLHALVDAPVLLAEHLLPELHESTLRLDDRTWLHTQLAVRDWDVKRTAQELGLGRTTLYRLIRRHRLVRPHLSPA